MPPEFPELSSLPPVELTRKLGRALYPGPEVAPAPMPEDLAGRVRWTAERGVNWFLLCLAIVNLVVVLFNFTYLELRHHYLAYAPALVRLYDPVKGIEPHQTTEAYVEAAERTFGTLRDRPGTPEAAAALTEMQGRSMTMLQDDPFSGVGLSGVFEQVKNRLRRHTKLESSKQAMNRFWSAENLTPERLGAEQSFFELKLRPLLTRNYYRGIGENGLPFDAFWMIDWCFVPFFVLEFLIRGFRGVRAKRYPSWKAFCLAHWYDMVYMAPLAAYLLPFANNGPIQLVRMVSVGYRMQRIGIINPMPAFERQQAKVTNLITDIVNVKLLTNYQDSINRFDLRAAMRALTPQQRAELGAFIDRNVSMVVTRVIPAIAPEIEELVTRAAYQALERSPAYQSLKRVPMVGQLTEQFLPALVTEVVAGTQAGITEALTDAESKRLLEATIAKLSDTLLAEMAAIGTEAEIKRLLVEALEEQKNKLLT